MSNAPSYMQRPVFSPEQMMRTEYLGYITDEQRATRRRVRTHPIDNVEPETATDRDDGIFVEAEAAGGGYRVHVTIADVAGYIPLQHDIARVAVRRGATRYLRGGSDPMFGTHALEHRMSLEHEKGTFGADVHHRP